MSTELISRKQQAQSDLGFTSEKEQREIDKAINREKKRKKDKYNKRLKIEQSLSYSLVKKISTIMDDYFLDPIIGFIPGIGDIAPSILCIPFLNISIFKVRSLPLTLAIIYNILMDILIGAIPMYIGDIFDFIHKAHKKNRKLIIGFVEDDREVINEVNSKSGKMAVLIILVCIIIYFIISWVAQLGEWIFSLFK